MASGCVAFMGRESRSRDFPATPPCRPRERRRPGAATGRRCASVPPRAAWPRADCARSRSASAPQRDPDPPGRFRPTAWKRFSRVATPGAMRAGPVQRQVSRVAPSWCAALGRKATTGTTPRRHDRHSGTPSASASAGTPRFAQADWQPARPLLQAEAKARRSRQCAPATAGSPARSRRLPPRPAATSPRTLSAAASDARAERHGSRACPGRRAASAGDPPHSPRPCARAPVHSASFFLRAFFAFAAGSRLVRAW